MAFDAYLDIETTGLSRFYNEVTVIGIYMVNQNSDKFVQLVGENATRGKLASAIEGVGTIYTYNGSRFDLPFISTALGIDLTLHCQHKDLMYDCWRCNLHGGLKAVERTLGIARHLRDVDGYQAVVLWRRYSHYGDENALAKLLEYNKEDVMNLRVLRQRLGV